MENIKELATAFAKFQGLMKPIPTNKEVEIPTKSGRLIKFNYADLPQILSVVRPTLAECGLSITQVFIGKQIVTYLMHASGESIKSEITLTWPEDNKAAAAEITYFRRYAITSLLGLAAEDDMDGDTQAVSDKKPSSKFAERQETKPVTLVSKEQENRLIELGKGQGSLLYDVLKFHKVTGTQNLPSNLYDVVVKELTRPKAPSALASV